MYERLAITGKQEFNVRFNKITSLKTTSYKKVNFFLAQVVPEASRVMEGDVLEDDGITAAIEELQSRLGDLQNSIDQALQVHTYISAIYRCLP